MLSGELADLWRAYLRAEQDKLRGETMVALDRFIDRLLQEPDKTWHEWAKDVARSMSDSDVELPVRLPLLRRVLVPALTMGIRKSEPGCARWLASFGSILLHVHDETLPHNLRTETGLLIEAVRVDPGDILALRRLIDMRADYLEFTLHELPAGVLYGMDGATEDQCDELLQLLEEFKKQVSITEQDEKFTDLIRDCEFHYHAYRNYRRSGPFPGGYAEYLDQLSEN